MIGNMLKKLEDPSQPLLGPNVKALKIFGLILPDSVVMKCFYLLCFHGCAFFFIVAAFVDVGMIKSDIHLFLENVKITILATVSAAKLVTFIYWQEDWKSIIAYVNTADIKQRKSFNLKDMEYLQNLTRYCRKITYFYWSLMLTTNILIILQPLTKYVSSPIYRENVKNGTEAYIQVLSSWLPFDKNTLSGHLAASVYYFFVVLIGSGWITSYDSNAMVIMVFFKGELELLRKDLSQIFGTSSDLLTDEEAMERIKMHHTRHVQLIHYAKLFNRCVSPIMFFYMLICSMGLCVTAYQITIATSTAQRVLATEYLVFNIAQLFMYCWHANDVYFASYNLMHGPYESIWWTRNVKLQKLIFILTAQLKTLVIFTVGPFADLTIATFLNILKGAYSYYTLLSQSQI